MASTVKNFLHLFIVSLIWFAIGWFANTLFSNYQGYVSLAPAQSRVAKAHTLLANRQLRHDEQMSDAAVADALGEAAIDGMLAWSQDGNADLYGPAAAARYEMDVQGLTGVPGYWFDVTGGEMVVTDVAAGSNADKAGLQVGDILVSADGTIFDETNIGNEASFLQRGPIGSTLQLQVKRGNELLAFDIVRQAQTFVSSRMLQDGIGYLDIDLFIPGLETRLQVALEGLLDAGAKALVLDLRRNDGGSVDTTRSFLSYFIQNGALYTLEFRDGSQHIFEANGNAFVPDIPIVILVDEFTNSSAEIAVLGLQEYKETVVIGEKTTGKGTVQDTVALDEHHLLHFTIAHWLTPANESIDGSGITPDIRLVDNPETATDELLDRAVTSIQQKL